MWFKQLYKVYKLAQLQAGSFEANEHVTCHIHIFSCLLSCCFALAWIMETSHFQCPLTLIIKLVVITSLHSPRTVQGCVSSRLSVVWFGAGLGTLCLNLNPEVWLRCGCKPGAPEVWGLKWAKYGKRSKKKNPAKSPNLAKIAICCTSNLNLRCGSGLHLVLQVRELDC